MCSVLRCPVCGHWRLSSCEVHGWSVDDFEPGQLCGCQAAAKHSSVAAGGTLSGSDFEQPGRRDDENRR